MSDAAVRAALDRLLAGRSLHTDGRLTGGNLAKEAGLARSTLYARFKPLVDELNAHRDRLAAQAPAVDANLAVAARLREQLRAEQVKAQKYRRERDDARAQAHTFANHIAVLDEHAQRLEEQLQEARKVTDLAARRGSR